MLEKLKELVRKCNMKLIILEEIIKLAFLTISINPYVTSINSGLSISISLESTVKMLIAARGKNLNLGVDNV